MYGSEVVNGLPAALDTTNITNVDILKDNVHLRPELLDPASTYKVVQEATRSPNARQRYASTRPYDYGKNAMKFSASVAYFRGCSGLRKI